MTELIKEPIAELRDVVVGKPASHPSMPKPTAKVLPKPFNLQTVGIVAILASALCLSAASNFLFFKELLIACSIVGLALLARHVGNPTAIPAEPNSFDPRLN